MFSLKMLTCVTSKYIRLDAKVIAISDINIQEISSSVWSTTCLKAVDRILEVAARI